MKGLMDPHRNSDSPELDRFDAWLRSRAVQPRTGFLQCVRARLADPDAELDRAIDQLFLRDPLLRNPRMAAIVRQRMGRQSQAAAPAPSWFNWLVPLAAAATLAAAFVSFQTRAPRPSLIEGVPATAAVQGLEAGTEDIQLTEIFALASNLHGGPGLTELGSVENLAFLFD